MVKMYIIDNDGILRIVDVHIKEAMLIYDDKLPFKYHCSGFKFLTYEEWEECSQMDNDQRKLYYELKEN